MANVKFIAVSRSLSGILDYVTNREKTVDSLISGVNCVAETAQAEFEAVKKQFRKTDGRSYYHRPSLLPRRSAGLQYRA